MMGTIVTIPFGHCFLRTLANFILTDHSGSRTRFIWLPTNRSVLSLKQEFIKLVNEDQHQTNFLLPESLSFTDFADKNPFILKEIYTLPQKISNIARLALMMDLLPKSFSPHKQIRLARYLIQLHDECTIADVPLHSLETLFHDDRLHTAPKHIQDAAQHLRVLTQIFPSALENLKLITPAMRQGQALKYTAQYLTTHQLDEKIIIGGTTGTVPATRCLIKAVQNLPNGMVILPGFEDGEGERIKTMPSHPQHTLYDLCNYLNIDLKKIENLKYQNRENINLNKINASKNLFLCFPLNKVKNPLQNDPILIECESLWEESKVISAIVRKKIFEDKSTIAIVTPNQKLMTRLKYDLKRFGIEPNLSAGSAFSTTPVGSFLMTLAQFLKTPSRPAFIHLAKHSLCKKNNRMHHLRSIRNIEITMRKKQLSWHQIEGIDFINTLAEILQNRTNCLTFLEFLVFFEKTAQTLTDSTLFDKNDGISASDLFTSLFKSPPKINTYFKGAFEDAFLLLLDEAAPLHDTASTDTRVQILGTLEARLNTADCIICASLNEGNWPKTPESDPYLSTQSRLEIGLPSQKRQQGLAAHDLCSAFHAKDLYFTRSKTENGETTLQSRLWTRLSSYFQNDELKVKHIKEIAHYKQVSSSKSCPPPSPTPPEARRPKTYFASHIEQLIKDPYAYYVRHILKLTTLDSLNEALTAKDKGQLFHEILDTYLRSTENPGIDQLIHFSEPYFINQKQTEQKLHESIFENGKDLARLQTFWWHRFKRIANWWHDKLDCEQAYLRKTELNGAVEIFIDQQAFQIKSRADRIEIPIFSSKSSSPFQSPIRLIDYKTGPLPTLKAIQTGDASQLLVEAIIANGDGFGPEFSNRDYYFCEYWKLSGGDPAGNCLELQFSKDEVNEHEKFLKTILQYFNTPQNPYLSNPSYQIDHSFARFEEWESVII